MSQESLVAAILPDLLVLLPGLALLVLASILRRRARADRTILDAFELGGRLSLDPVEVTGSRLLQHRLQRLKDLGLLKATPRGMLVPEIEALASSIVARRRLSLWLLVAGLLLAAGGLALIWSAHG